MKTEKVTFKNIAWDNAGIIYFPADFDPQKKYPTVVSLHPIGSCKEQTAGNVYGKALAEAGFVVLAI
ncbi:alpha/beta hydrolase [Sphingobacterium sp. HMA12]|uniref:alpha/beta hydrolase n=1 Tax=Sphingobacterium sp. HMA12 TaxID=2050894 RepID=UPI0018F7EDEF|nr:alpha/beta hydrolase [Sphingobacterium sp. HMA12]